MAIINARAKPRTPRRDLAVFARGSLFPQLRFQGQPASDPVVTLPGHSKSLKNSGAKGFCRLRGRSVYRTSNLLPSELLNGQAGAYVDWPVAVMRALPINLNSAHSPSIVGMPGCSPECVIRIVSLAIGDPDFPGQVN